MKFSTIFRTDWEERGFQQGKLESRQENLMIVLEARFEDVPPEFEKFIKKIEDIEVLENLLVQAVKAPSLKSFKSSISQHITTEQQ